MKKTVLSVLAIVVLLLLSFGPGILAQSTQVSSLSNLPEAEALIYINPQRIINEALPKVMPEKELAGMREGFAMMKQQAGIDPAKIDYIRSEEHTSELQSLAYLVCRLL